MIHDNFINIIENYNVQSNCPFSPCYKKGRGWHEADYLLCCSVHWSSLFQSFLFTEVTTIEDSLFRLFSVNMGWQYQVPTRRDVKAAVRGTACRSQTPVF